MCDEMKPLVIMQRDPATSPSQRVAIYMYGDQAPSSTSSNSIIKQRQKIHAFCQREKHTVVAVYCDGKGRLRPAWDRLLEAAAKKRFQAVVVGSYCRLSRDRVDAELRRRALQERGIRLVTADGLDGQALQVSLRRLLRMMDEYHSQQAGRDISRGMAENMRRGFFNGGKTPYGFQAVPVQPESKSSRKRLTISVEEAAVVRAIFAAYLLGHGSRGPMNLPDLAEWLHDQGHRDRKGVRWTPVSLRRMLGNSIYKGEYRRGAEGGNDGCVSVSVPAIVTKESFGAAQELLRIRRR